MVFHISFLLHFFSLLSAFSLCLIFFLLFFFFSFFLSFFFTYFFFLLPSFLYSFSPSYLFTYLLACLLTRLLDCLFFTCLFNYLLTCSLGSIFPFSLLACLFFNLLACCNLLSPSFSTGFKLKTQAIALFSCNISGLLSSLFTPFFRYIFYLVSFLCITFSSFIFLFQPTFFAGPANCRACRLPFSNVSCPPLQASTQSSLDNLFLSGFVVGKFSHNLPSV